MSLGELLSVGPGGFSDDTIPGVMTGFVSQIGTGNNAGKVMVNFKWRGKNDQSNWARVAGLMAGDNKGTYFMPEVEDEVVVAFGNGDINDPIVIGVVWKHGHTPPDTNSSGNNDVRMIKSKSGHQLILDDTSGQEKIEIKDKSGQNLITFDSTNNSVKICSGGDLNITAKGSININSTGVFKINGSNVLINS